MRSVAMAALLVVALAGCAGQPSDAASSTPSDTAARAFCGAIKQARDNMDTSPSEGVDVDSAKSRLASAMALSSAAASTPSAASAIAHLSDASAALDKAIGNLNPEAQFTNGFTQTSLLAWTEYTTAVYAAHNACQDAGLLG